MTLLLTLTVGLLTSGSAWGQSTEYRRIHVDDGRILLGAVEASTATGLEVSLPQGRTTLRYEQVLNLEEIAPTAVQNQPAWSVALVLPAEGSDPRLESLRIGATAALGAIPATTTTASRDLLRLSQDDRQALVGCRGDATCLQPLTDLSGAAVLVSMTFETSAPDSAVLIATTFAQAPRARREINVSWETDPAALQASLLRGTQLAMHLQPAPATARVLTPPVEPPPIEPPPVAKAEPPELSEGRLRALAWLPVPGLPSLARRDWAGFGASWGVAVPGSLAMFALAGEASFSRAQLAATGIGSFYLLTVTTNTAFGLRGLETTVAVAPLPEGGAAVQVSGPLGERRSRR